MGVPLRSKNQAFSMLFPFSEYPAICNPALYNTVAICFQVLMSSSLHIYWGPAAAALAFRFLILFFITYSSIRYKDAMNTTECESPVIVGRLGLSI